jgi:hypothetical protein
LSLFLVFTALPVNFQIQDLSEQLTVNNPQICLLATGNIAVGVSVSVQLSTAPGSVAGEHLLTHLFILETQGECYCIHHTLTYTGVSALPGSDYDPIPSPPTLAFSAGNLLQCTTIATVDNLINEPQEVLTLTATAQDPQILLQSPFITLLINDDDPCEFQAVGSSIW